MKRILMTLFTLFFAQVTTASCLMGMNNPTPFPLNIEIFTKYERNWILTQNHEISLRINRIRPEVFNYFMVNHMTETVSRGHLVFMNNQFCDLKNRTPFCLYDIDDTLRIKINLYNKCIDSGLSILSLVR